MAARRLGTLMARYDGSRRRVTLTLTKEQRADIDALLARGLFGLNTSDCVRRMIDEALRQRAVEGWLPMPPKLTEPKLPKPSRRTRRSS